MNNISKVEIVEIFNKYLGRNPTEKYVNDVFKRKLNLLEFKLGIISSKEYRIKNFKNTSRFHLKWPKSRWIVSHSMKVIYCPIAKVGTSSFTRAIAELEFKENKLKYLQGDLNLNMESYKTGLLLWDYNLKEVERLLKCYETVAIIRNPLKRVLSAYLDKFVYNRKNYLNQFHTNPVINYFYNEPTIKNVEKGISFNQFVEFICSSKEEDLDTHWRPQYLYIKTLTIDKFLKFEDMELIWDYFNNKSNCGINITHLNSTKSPKTKIISNVASKTASEIESFESIDAKDFFTKENRNLLEEYYSIDCNLHNLIS